MFLVAFAFSCLAEAGDELLRAASRGDLKTVKELISKGADPNLPDSDAGLTPLTQASFQGHLDVVRTLLDAGAHINAASKIGFTALTQACVKGHTDVVRLLLSKGADPNTRSLDGQTPLMLTAGLCQQKCAAVVETLLKSGADVNAKDKSGGTALMQAPFFDEFQVKTHAYFGEEDGDLAVAKLLVDAGAKIDEQDRNGMTALSYAQKHNRPKIVTMLRKAGAKK